MLRQGGQLHPATSSHGLRQQQAGMLQPAAPAMSGMVGVVAQRRRAARPDNHPAELGVAAQSQRGGEGDSAVAGHQGQAVADMLSRFPVFQMALWPTDRIVDVVFRLGGRRRR